MGLRRVQRDYEAAESERELIRLQSKPTSGHQREVFSVKGWAGARVLVVGPCIAVIEVCSAACDRVVSTTGRGGL